MSCKSKSGILAASHGMNRALTLAVDGKGKRRISLFESELFRRQGAICADRHCEFPYQTVYPPSIIITAPFI